MPKYPNRVVMWDSDYAISARIRQLKRERDSKKKKNPAPQLSLTRVTAEIKTRAIVFQSESEQVVPARFVLTDLSPRWIYLFTAEPLKKGQEFAITVEEPIQFYVRGKVAWSYMINMSSKVLFQAPFRYRVGIKLEFASQVEKDRVTEYSKKLMRLCFSPTGSD